MNYDNSTSELFFILAVITLYISLILIIFNYSTISIVTTIISIILFTLTIITSKK